MEILEFKEAFNNYSNENGQNIIVQSVTEPKEYEDEVNKDFKVGFATLSDGIHILLFTSNGGTITGIEMLGGNSGQQGAVSIYIASCMLIDVLTEMKQEKRNDVIKRLGLNNGSFINGRSTAAYGHKFKANLIKGIFKFSIIL